MKLFRCEHCGNTVYFENVVCEGCGHRLGYWHEANTMVSLDGEGHVWTAPALPGKTFVFCANAGHGACNWLVEHDPGGNPYCRACRHNEIVPPVDDAQSLVRWQAIERAKKRLIYSLLRLQLPLATRHQDPAHGLGFRFLDEAISLEPVITGHRNGVITIALAEASDAERESRRSRFNEPYRTLLGHFRHEIGHYYWDVLVAGTDNLGRFRALFGDETANYDASLGRHYAQGASVDWWQSCISAYATSHPWEDFAETWAHYLHLVDTTEMAAAFGLRIAPGVDAAGVLTAGFDLDPYNFRDIGELVDRWVPLAALMNNLNRAVGQTDAYPFVLMPQVIEKLDFIHQLIRAAGSAQWTVAGPNAERLPINTPAG